MRFSSHNIAHFLHLLHVVGFDGWYVDIGCFKLYFRGALVFGGLQMMVKRVCRRILCIAKSIGTNRLGSFKSLLWYVIDSILAPRIVWKGNDSGRMVYSCRLPCFRHLLFPAADTEMNRLPPLHGTSHVYSFVCNIVILKILSWNLRVRFL